MEHRVTEVPQSLIAGEEVEQLFAVELSDPIPPLYLRANDQLICRPPDDRPIGPDQPIIIDRGSGSCVSQLPLDAESALVGVVLSVFRVYSAA